VSLSRRCSRKHIRYSSCIPHSLQRTFGLVHHRRLATKREKAWPQCIRTLHELANLHFAASRRVKCHLRQKSAMWNAQAIVTWIIRGEDPLRAPHQWQAASNQRRRLAAVCSTCTVHTTSLFA
jgi:hypothetical protein